MRVFPIGFASPPPARVSEDIDIGAEAVQSTAAQTDTHCGHNPSTFHRHLSCQSTLPNRICWRSVQHAVQVRLVDEVSETAFDLLPSHRY